MNAVAETNPQVRGMGTTATVAAVAGQHVAVAQIGDSRGYLLRGRELVQLTRDDTLMEEMLRQGRLSPEEAESFPHKNVLLQVLGSGVPPKVAVSTFEARHEDVLLLCTDGLHGMVGDEILRAVLLRHRAPGVAARVLLDEALRAGGNDNIALLVARLDGGDLETGDAAPEVLRVAARGG
jgi:protein phosphatase